MKLKIEVTVSAEVLADVLETAQIGSNYWADFGDMEPDQGLPLFPQAEIDKLNSADWVKSVLSGMGKIKISDTENSSEVHGYLTAEVLYIGMERFSALPVAVLAMFYDEQYDADLADFFLQLTLFGEQIFS